MDVYNTLTHDVVLGRIWNPGLKRAARGSLETQDPKTRQKATVWAQSHKLVAMRLAKFINDCSLLRCDDLFPSQKVDTYVNISLNHQSRIDYNTCFNC